MSNRVLELDPNVWRDTAPRLVGSLVTVANQVRDILNDGGVIDIGAIFNWVRGMLVAAPPGSEAARLLIVALTFIEAGFPPETNVDTSEDSNAET